MWEVGRVALVTIVVELIRSSLQKHLAKLPISIFLFPSRDNTIKNPSTIDKLKNAWRSSQKAFLE